MHEFNLSLSRVEVNSFLKRINLVRSEPSLEFLTEIVENIISNLPFQNLSMLSDENIRPSMVKIKNDMLSGLGGLCTVRNPFLFCLLKSLGFEVSFVSSTMIEPDCHISLVVNLGSDYWVDIGNGYPYFEPIKLGDRTEVHNWFFSYRLAEKDGIYSVQHFSKSRKEWVENHSFENIPVSYSQFDRMHDLHYRVPGWGPFLTGIRVNRFWKNGGVILRDFLATDPNGQSELKKNEELLEWLEKWFNSDFTEQIDLTRALKNLDIYREEDIRNGNDNQ